MRLSPPALERLKAAPLSGPGLANIFEELFKMASVAGDGVVSVTLDYQTEDATDADLIPCITLSLRPAYVQSSVDVPSGPASEQ